MMRRRTPYRAVGALVAATAVGVGLLPGSAAAQPVPLYLENFAPAAPQGFGDPDNTFPRAIQWWNGRLYVGVQRAYGCTQAAILAKYTPKQYPPADPTLTCAPDPRDLPLRGEIWRWTPDPANPAAPGTWDRVYLSPNDVLIPGTAPEKFTSREMGFRDMALLTEADGTQAMYVAGTTARGFIDGLPPPTILRSTDGEHFAPVPQDPGTFLGSLDEITDITCPPTVPDCKITVSSFNRMTTFNGKLYVVAGGDFGHGVLLEAANPACGNDEFRRVSPPGMTLTYMAEFNHALYVAEGAQAVAGNPPYRILKTSATGTPPYAFTLVLSGARLPSWQASKSSQSVANMHVSRAGNLPLTAHDALWIGTNQPAELVRINPNDTWDLFIGQPRQDDQGKWVYPNTGMGDGFDWHFNIHVHRMEDQNGFLYAATNDLSNIHPTRDLPGFRELAGSRFGMDVYRTYEGWYYYPVTINGFEEKDPGGDNNWFNFTGRVMASTPFGLFLGTGNEQHGGQIWRGRGGGPIVPPPQRLEAERTFNGVILTWDAAPTATRYRIFRADFGFGRQLGIPFWVGGTIYPRAFTEIGTSDTTMYTDATTTRALARQYYVVAENTPAGVRSNPSNFVRVPSLLPVVRFSSAKRQVSTWHAQGEMTPTLQWTLLANLDRMKALAFQGNYDAVKTQLLALQSTIPTLAGTGQVATWRARDLHVLVTKLYRRVSLAQLGKISVWSL